MSHRPVVTQPNTLSKKQPVTTCLVKSCKARVNLTNGFCKTHYRESVKSADAYENCKECNQHVDDKDLGVACEKCFVWFHSKCVGMSEDTYKFIVKENKGKEGKSQSLFWYCRYCKDRCLEAIEKIDLLENHAINLATQMTELKGRVYIKIREKR